MKAVFPVIQQSLDTHCMDQIRVHMQDLGHPVVGDEKYGATGNPIGRLGLHAKVLAFEHPITGKSLPFEADVPKSFFDKVK